MEKPHVIAAPPAGKKQEVFIQPNEAVKFDFDLKSVKVDILGSDIVFTFKDGAQLILTNFAVIMFSENAPHIMVGDNEVTGDQLLSQIGVVQSVSGRDAALLTSMEVDKNSRDPENHDVKVTEKIVYKVRDNPPIIVQPPPTLETSFSNLSHGAQFEQQIKKTFDELLISRTREIEQNTNVGKYTAAPVDLNPPRIQALAPEIAGGFDLGAPLVFSAKLLQLSPVISINSSNVLTYTGGTGSGAATLDPSFLTQTQSEFVDVTRHSGPATINADDATFTATNLLSRSVQIQPALPSGFELTSLNISGLPAGYTLKGFTPDMNGDYALSGTDLTAGRGPQKFVLQYDPTTLGAASDLDGDTIANEYAKFDVVIHTVMFDATRGLIITDDHTINVIVKNTNANDYSYVTDGWVLDTKPNENIIIAGDGGVTVNGGIVADRIATGTGNDTVYGNAGNDNINTSSGNDTIDPGTGNNIIDGGDGVDVLSYATRGENITIDLGGVQNGLGEITAYVGPSQQDQVKGIENLTTGTGDDTLIGNNADNVLNGGNGNDFFMGRGGNDTIIGGAGTDTISYSYAATGITIDLQAGNGLIAAGDTDAISGVENIIGSDLDDTLLGNAQANNLNGGTGNDLLNGRTGNDVLDGGSGINTASFADQTNGVSLTLQNAGDSTATAGADSITLRNIRNLIGSTHNDTLTGNNQDNTIEGGNGSDTLDGAGGTGDIVTYASQSAAVTADLGAGTVVKVSGSDTLANFEVFTATGFNDTILGGALINTINGGAGTDTLSYANIGTSLTVDMSAGTTTGALTQTFTGIENITGGSAADILTGDASTNTITGGAGNDTLNAGGGNDTLDGGTDSDTATFASYSGNIAVNLGAASLQVTDNFGGTVTLLNMETIVGTNSGDNFFSGATSRTLSLDGGAATDTINFSSESAVVTANLSSTATGNFGTYTFIGGRIENMVGGTNNDILTGTSGSNAINGGDGNDTINGNGGSDTIDGGNGTDTATFSTLGTAISANLATMQVTDGAAAVTSLSNIEAITGTAQNDTFLGGTTIQTLTLDGGAGTGDTIDFTALQATVTANLNTGSATAGFGVYTLSNIENIIGSTGADTITGSTGANTLNGGNGDDIINGFGGADTIIGGSGTDTATFATLGTAITVSVGAATVSVVDGAAATSTLSGIETLVATAQGDTFNSGATSRTITLDGGSGTDLMSFATETTSVTANLTSTATGAFGTYTFLGSRIENLTGGSGDDTLTGTTGNNAIIGGDGNDIINGNGGTDTIDGGNGTDTATFSTVGSAVAVAIAATPTVTYTSSSTTLTNIETIITGSAGDTFTAGGAGLTYSLDGGSGTDTITFASQANAVTADLTSTATGTFGTYTFINSSIENLTGGSNNDTLTGSAVANVIVGGSGNDTISGGDGNDTLQGGLGTDTINGGNNDDTIEDSSGTFATNGSNILNGDAGNDTFYVTVFSNTIDGGTGTNTLRYDNANGFGVNTTAALSITLNAGSTGGTVTDGTRTDTFSNITTFFGGTGIDTFTGGSGAEIFNGNNGDDIFRGRGGNDTFNGGNGTDTADYSSAAAGVTATLAGNAASNDGDGGVDTFNSIENLTGSGFDDTLTDDSNINVLNGGAGNDRFIVSGGNDTINGGADTDTLDYTAQTTAITYNLAVSSATSGVIGTDSYLNIEIINSGSGSDSVTGSPNNLFANTIQYNLGNNATLTGGDLSLGDKIVLSAGTVGTDATSFASKFDGVEYLDFRNANSAGGNMVIDGSDVVDMTSGSHALRLDISTGFGLTVQAGGYTLSQGATVGGVTTYTFLTGATPSATLEVHVI